MIAPSPAHYHGGRASSGRHPYGEARAEFLCLSSMHRVENTVAFSLPLVEGENLENADAMLALQSIANAAKTLARTAIAWYCSYILASAIVLPCSALPAGLWRNHKFFLLDLDYFRSLSSKSRNHRAWLSAHPFSDDGTANLNPLINKNRHQSLNITLHGVANAEQFP